MTITKDSTVDGQIYTKLLTEIESGVTNGYDGALVQDGYQLQMKGINTGYFVNYIPKEWAEANDTNKELNGNPFSLQYNMKTWMTHNLPSSSNKVVIDNVWDITADTYKGKIQTMDPRNENVNMDWLIMLTQDKWCDVLKEAYEDSTNDNKALKVESYAKYGEKQKYRSRKRLYEIGQQLGKQFMQISKSTLINLSYMDSIEPGFSGTLLLKLKNGCKDYVSRTYLPEFKKYLGL